jgi:sn-glycerol 3-phosphate transport system substrate-binding protein
MSRTASSRRTVGRRELGRALVASLGAATLGWTGAGCAPADDGVPLWFSYGGKNREALLALVERFNARDPQHRLKPVYQGDYFELLAKLRTALHAGAAPGVTHVIGEVLPYLAEAGVLLPLTAQPALAGDLGLVPALTQEGAFEAGGARPLYGLPFNRSTPIAYVRGDVLRELDRPPPATWDELRSFAKAATRGEGSERRYGLGCPVDWWFWVALVGQAGGRLTDDEGRFVLGGEAGVEALAFWHELVHEARVMRPPPGRDYNAWQVNNGDFLAGRAAMIWSSTAFVRYLEDNAKFQVVTARLPAKTRRAVPTGGTMFVLPRGVPEAWTQAGAAFLRFMSEPESANAFATRTGYITTSKHGVLELERSGFYAAHPNDRVALDQLEDVVPWPWSPQLFRVQREIVQPLLEASVLERIPPREALARARRAIAEAG